MVERRTRARRESAEQQPLGVNEADAATSPPVTPPRAEGPLQLRHEFAGHQGRVSRIAFLNDEQVLTGGNSSRRFPQGREFLNVPGEDNTIRCWAFDTARQDWSIEMGLGGRKTWGVQGLMVSGGRIAVATCRPSANFGEPTVTVWDPITSSMGPSDLPSWRGLTHQGACQPENACPRLSPERHPKQLSGRGDIRAGTPSGAHRCGFYGVK